MHGRGQRGPRCPLPRMQERCGLTSRAGGRQVNAALHRIALTQARAWPQGRDYIAKRLRQGNTKAEALRLLRRRLSDVVYCTLLADELAAQPDLGIHTHKT